MIHILGSTSSQSTPLPRSPRYYKIKSYRVIPIRKLTLGFRVNLKYEPRTLNPRAILRLGADNRESHKTKNPNPYWNNSNFSK